MNLSEVEINALAEVKKKQPVDGNFLSFERDTEKSLALLGLIVYDVEGKMMLSDEGQEYLCQEPYP